MRRMQIGSLDVSRICLGTMTWGEQNTQDEAFSQMELALARGVNFWDTAEMYPVPPKAETYTATETILGNWFRKSGRRPDVVLATKVIGNSAGHPWVRHGKDNGLRKASFAGLARIPCGVCKPTISIFTSSIGLIAAPTSLANWALRLVAMITGRLWKKAWVPLAS